MSNVKEKEWYDNLVDFAVDSLSGEDVCRYYDIFPIGCSFQEYCEAIKKVIINCGYRYDDKSAEKLIKDDNIAIVLMTTKIVNLCPDVVSKYKLELSKPLLVEIPDRHGSAEIGETIDKYISEAIGIKL